MLSDCFEAARALFEYRGLPLNPTKPEVIVLGTGVQQKLEEPIIGVSVADFHISVSDTVRSLGVTVDSTLSFNRHVEKVCKAANHHIRAFCCIRKMHVS